MTVGLLWALTREFRAIPDDLSVPGWTIPTYVAIVFACYFTRIGRWLFLLQPLGRVPVGVGFAAGLAGTMWIAVLPWRLGELARPLILTQNSDLRFGPILGTVALERVMDGLFVCGLFFTSLALTEPLPGHAPIRAASVGVVALFSGALVVLLAMARWPRVLSGVIERTVGRVAPGLARTLAGLASGIAAGLQALPSIRPFALFLLAASAYWALNALGMWVLARGCGIPLSPWETVAVMAMINLALLIPGPPAQLGTFHLGVLTGLSFYHAHALVDGPGVVYAFYLYACQMATITALGLASHLRLRLDITGFGRALVEGEAGLDGDMSQESARDAGDGKPR
ncbi:MAG: flippase-like domain-containing protein [Myxococcales bacterium]|nr:flippase-like domain-containing protein [Myxococcales bacterium]